MAITRSKLASAKESISQMSIRLMVTRSSSPAVSNFWRATSNIPCEMSVKVTW